MERQIVIFFIIILIMIIGLYIYNNPDTKIIHANANANANGITPAIAAGIKTGSPGVCQKCIKGKEAVNKSGLKYSSDICFVDNGILTPTNFISGVKNRCFYHCVSFAVHGTINFWEEMRKKAWDNINLLDYETDLLTLNVHNIMDLERKYPDGTPQDVLFAKPLAFDLKRKITVFDYLSGWTYVFDKDGTYKVYDGRREGIKKEDVCCNAIKLFFNKNHYELFEFKAN